MFVSVEIYGGVDMSREEDREKFKRLAESRVNKALRDIRLIGNLSNRSNYDYSDTDAIKIYKVLKQEIDVMKAKFDAKGAVEKDVFKL